MKIKRHAKILEILDQHAIETQEELAEKLKEAGFDITQATISRDIKEMKLVKMMDASGRYRYSKYRDDSVPVNERMMNVFREAVTHIDYAGNIVVVKTLSGMAHAAAVTVDLTEWSEIVGCLAGDDTIFILVKTEQTAMELVSNLKKYIK